MNYLTIVVGEQGSGKTFFLREKVVNKFLGKRNILIFNPANEISWSEIKDKKFKNISPTDFDIDTPLKENYSIILKEIIKQFRNGILILDDCRPLISNNFSDTLYMLLSFRRQMGTEMFFVFHSIDSVPRLFWQYANFVLLFRTKENEANYKKKIPEKLFKAIAEANKKKIYPKIISV